MIFLLYNQGAPDGNFQEGAIYFGKDEMDAGASSRVRFYVWDDDGVRHHFRFDDGWFTQLDQIYAVYVGNGSDIDLDVGEAVIVIDKDDDFLEVAGYGYIQRCNFEILDRTIVKPNMMVQDESTGLWVKIMRVSEDLHISTSLDPETLRPPNDYQWAVANREVLDDPLLYCINSIGASLTVGKTYTPQSSEGGLCIVKDDNGLWGEFDLDRFSLTRPDGGK